MYPVWAIVYDEPGKTDAKCDESCNTSTELKITVHRDVQNKTKQELDNVQSCSIVGGAQSQPTTPVFLT